MDYMDDKFYPVDTFDEWIIASFQAHGQRDVLSNNPMGGNALQVATAYGRVHGLVDQMNYLDNLWENRDNPFLKGMADALTAYVSASDVINSNARGSVWNDHIWNLDQLFENIPPLSQPLTVYRVYTTGAYFVATNQGMMSQRPEYLSTSLSLTVTSNEDFHTGRDHPVYIRIDLAPGMKVIPVFNFLQWNRGAYQTGLTEYEVILPRHAHLYTVIGQHVPEFSQRISFPYIGRPGLISAELITYHVIIAPIGSGIITFAFTNRIGNLDIVGTMFGGENNMNDYLILQVGDELTKVYDKYDNDMPLSVKILNLVENTPIKYMGKKPKPNLRKQIKAYQNPTFDITNTNNISTTVKPSNKNKINKITIPPNIVVGGKYKGYIKRKYRKNTRKINKLKWNTHTKSKKVKVNVIY